MEFLRTVVQQDVALTASSVTDLIDLPVNPISHILFTVRGVNDTGTLSNYRALTQFMSWVSNLEVLYKGQQVIAGSLTDLAVLNALLTGYVPGVGQMQNTNNDFRWATFCLAFGRHLFSQEECFPATTRGDLQLRVTTAAAPTGMDAAFMQVETVELPNANPNRFCKYTSYTGTSTVTGELDRDLPRGNPILGVQLFGTTVQQVTGSANTIEQVKLLVDNVEKYYALANWETLHGELTRRVPLLGGGSQIQGHFHHLATTAGADVDTDQQELTEEAIENYAYMDFDPTRDGQYALETSGRGRVAMRINYGDTNAMRFMPIELVSVSGAPASAA